MDNRVRAKLPVSDAAAALAFYADALGGVETGRHTAGDRIVFASLEVFGTTITIKDADEHDPAPGDAHGPILDCVLDDVDTVWTALVDAGCEVRFPLADQPYGARAGRLRDPFGVQWLLSTPPVPTGT